MVKTSTGGPSNEDPFCRALCWPSGLCVCSRRWRVSWRRSLALVRRIRNRGRALPGRVDPPWFPRTILGSRRYVDIEEALLFSLLEAQTGVRGGTTTMHAEHKQIERAL